MIKFLLPLILFVSPSQIENKKILLIIADDLGINALSAYGLRDNPQTHPFPVTPNIDLLIENGIKFNNFYTYPECSPTRASIQTGRYGFRTGIGKASLTYSLQIDEFIIPEILDLNPQLNYSHAMIGKWHITNSLETPFNAPNDYGYNFFSGTPFNIGNYCDWNKVVNGEQVTSSYATTDNVNDAMSWISKQNTNWFMTLAFNSPHFPFHVPPAIGDNCTFIVNGNIEEEFNMMIERIDYELGILFSILNLNETTIIFIGDNGSSGELTFPPFDPNRSKTSLYEGGIRAPLIISYGQIINPGRVSNRLVNSVDLFSTILELAGVNVFTTLPCHPIDSKSLFRVIKSESVPQRKYVISETFVNGEPENASFCIRDTTYKFIHFKSEEEELYNLLIDPYENNNLLNGDLSQQELIILNNLKNTVYSLRETVSECNEMCCNGHCYGCCQNSDCGSGRFCNNILHKCVDTECIFDEDCINPNGNYPSIPKQRGCCLPNGVCDYHLSCLLK